MNTRQVLIKEFFMSMLSIQRILGPAHDAFFKQYKISGPQAELLYFLKFSETMCVRDIAAMMNTTSGAATQLVEGLVQSGVVKRHLAKGDRRYVYISLTEKGQEFFNSFQADHLAHLGEMLAMVIVEARAKVISHYKLQGN
jgi:DNA-binding MarR family transcriptional regulator